jgi:hypothetical protein
MLMLTGIDRSIRHRALVPLANRTGDELRVAIEEREGVGVIGWVDGEVLIVSKEVVSLLLKWYLFV